MLVKANVSNVPDLESLAEGVRESRKELAMRLAQDCRYIIQGRRREEEWLDADQESFRVIEPHV